MSFKSYCATVFPPTDDAVEDYIRDLTVWAVDHTNRFLAGRETCPRTGRLHLQCCFTLKRNARLPQLKNLLRRFNEPHLEPARNMHAAIEYCRKDNDIVIDYTVTQQGKRTDLDEAISALKEGGLRKVASDHPRELIKYPSGFRFLASFQRAPIDRDIEGFLFLGPPGAGKSRAANAWQPVFRPRIIRDAPPWFDGYVDQTTLVLDDYSGEWGLSWLKQLTDRYAIDLPTKGGSTPALFTRIIITSNSKPEDWYPKATPDDIAAIYRRLSTVTNPPYPTPESCQPRSPVSTPLAGNLILELD